MQCLTEIQPEALVVPTARELRMLFTAQKEASWDDHGMGCRMEACSLVVECCYNMLKLIKTLGFGLHELIKFGAGLRAWILYDPVSGCSEAGRRAAGLSSRQGMDSLYEKRFPMVEDIRVLMVISRLHIWLLHVTA